jgi:4-hydroxy-2-oxoglutarate aldolase
MRFRGVYPPIPTSFHSATGEVDARAMRENVERWMRTGLRGVVALGSNGEAALLDEAESDAVVAAVREAVPDDRVLIVGTGRESTRATIAASVRAARLGAHAVLVRTPSFFKSQMTTEPLVAHYTAVADASPVPVLLYNLPGVTGINLAPAQVATLSAHPNIVGMKETSPDIERLAQFVTGTPDAFEVFCGWAPVVYPALASGAAGAILAVANVVPDACVALYAHVADGRHADACALQRRITPLAQLVTATYGVPGLKLALELAGFHGGPARAPLTPPPARARDEIAAALRQARGQDS